MAILFPLWVFGAGLGTGYAVFSVLKVPFRNRFEKIVFSAAGGLGFCGYLVYVLGLGGLMKPALLIPLLSLGWIPAAVVLMQNFRSLKSEASMGIPAFLSLICLLLVIAFGYFVSLVPPTAHDALCYHLYIPSVFARTGTVAHLPYLVNSLFPFLVQMLYGLASLLGLPQSAAAFHFLCAVTAAAGLISFCRRTMSWSFSIAAALFFLLTPGIFKQSILPYNDIALTCFIFFSFLSVVRLAETEFDPKWFMMTGIFLGFSFSIKYLALLAAPGLLAVFVFSGRGKSLKLQRCLKGLVLAFAMTLLFGSVWYIRSWVLEGNPLYPFFPSIFGGTGHEYNLSKAGYGKGLIDMILVPFRLTLYPERFGGSWTRLGFGYLALLPGLLFLDGKQRETRAALLFVTLYSLLWFFLVQNARFLFPVLPLLAFVLVLGVRKVPFILILLLGLYGLECVYSVRGLSDYLLGRQSYASYLERNERTYVVGREMAKVLPENAVILNMEEVRMFYLPGSMIRAKEFFTRHPVQNADMEKLVDLFKDIGITHVLQVDGPFEDKGSRDHVLLDEMFKKRLKIFFNKTVRDSSGTWTYALSRFNPDPVDSLPHNS